MEKRELVWICVKANRKVVDDFSKYDPLLLVLLEEEEQNLGYHIADF